MTCVGRPLPDVWQKFTLDCYHGKQLPELLDWESV